MLVAIWMLVLQISQVLIWACSLCLKATFVIGSYTVIKCDKDNLRWMYLLSTSLSAR
jgi:hypothetical protein